MISFQKLMDKILEMKKLDFFSEETIVDAIDNMPSIRKTLNIYLYRARMGEQFDINKSFQFSYNHDISKITKQRYNKDQEAVLYTSTDPQTAFQEIKNKCQSEVFYIAVISPHKNTIKFNCALNINSDNLKPYSNAEKYYKEIKNKFLNNPEKMDFYSNIGKMLEEDNDYNFSSNYASMLFQQYESFITVSAKSKGGELNVTFSKTAVDKKLKVVRVFECMVPKDYDIPQYFKVLRIGVCSGNRVEWYNWEIDPKSIKCHKTNKPLFFMKTDLREQLMYPNVICKNLDNDYHIGIINNKIVDFKIKLLK